APTDARPGKPGSGVGDSLYLFRLPRGGDGTCPHQDHVRIWPVRQAAGTDRNGSLAPGGPAALPWSGEHHSRSTIPEEYGGCDAQYRAATVAGRDAAHSE